MISNPEKTAEEIAVEVGVTKRTIERTLGCCTITVFLRFVHDDYVYCKYYETMYILFHTGLRISEFCGLTDKDIDFENMIIDVNKQLHRDSKMNLMINPTKTNAGTRKLPMTEDVAKMFMAILQDREMPRFDKGVDGYKGFLFYDKKGLPEVSMNIGLRI